MTKAPQTVEEKRKRLIQWWAILNSKDIPSDLPIGCDPDALFRLLNRTLTESERLAFWNGEFEHGLNSRRFI